jgi:hypothetical protein
MPRTRLSDTRGAFWSYTSCVFRFNLFKAYEDSAEGCVRAAQPQVKVHGPVSRLAGGFCEANFRFRYYDGDQSKDCLEDRDTKGPEKNVVEP